MGIQLESEHLPVTVSVGIRSRGPAQSLVQSLVQYCSISVSLDGDAPHPALGWHSAV